MKRLLVFLATIPLLVACNPASNVAEEPTVTPSPDITPAVTTPPPPLPTETKQAVSSSKIKETPPAASSIQPLHYPAWGGIQIRVKNRYNTKIIKGES
jgi:hypothetical protein